VDKRSSIIIAVIILIGTIGFFIVSFQKSSIDTAQREQEVASTTAWENTPAEQPVSVLITPKTIVTAKHAYQNGIHTFAGEVPLPTSCHILEQSILASKDKMHIFITLTSSIKTNQICAQVITPARFKLVINAKKNATVTTILNGQEITLNLIEAGPDENLDNFELYIKG